MAYEHALAAATGLIQMLGEGNAHLIWALGLYLEEPDLPALASEALTDGTDDKKIDFIYLDRDAKRIVFAQGYYSASGKSAAPANKASDLNTAGAWLISGDVAQVPDTLKSVISECRAALSDGEIEQIELLYVHNLPESVNVNRELQTAAAHLRKSLGDASPVRVTSREVGRATIENLFISQDSHIEIKEEIPCPARPALTESGPKWEASVLSVPGIWLHGLFQKYGDALFSANYRGFLGITKRRRINTGIRQSAELKPQDFWVFNNGITLLTHGTSDLKDGTMLTGLSVINGAQTTGSIGSVDLQRHDLKDVRVLCRVIKCTDDETISEIVKYNNTQNEIMTWDQYSNDPEQFRIENEFKEIGHTYSRKRGFKAQSAEIGIEEVAQPLLAFHGKVQDANRGKNLVFDRKPLYKNAFESKKARHILFVYALARAVDERRIELKLKSDSGTIIGLEEEQLSLFRSLRFKSFLIATIARCLEAVIGRKVDVEQVAFSDDACKSGTVLALAAEWTAVVEAVLSFLQTQLDLKKFSERSDDDALIGEIAKTVSAMLYASRKTLSLDPFISKVVDF